jgi:hypothetical protein
VTRTSTLLLAALIASPALWQALVTQQLDLTTALTRFLIAVPVSAVMLAMVRGLAAGYRRVVSERKPAGEPAGRRRKTDDAEAS